ncbi:endonuclease NucS domain-containing protein [Tardiphaga robiniae]|uniref:DUF91 domain-containing protein n=1 Tax=Tardiphaga robiniae TaxID=943830 RepID=A0A7G6TWA3_9BRAD|nr:endonuclease NucS domain-containing protein [Tardiphaga robiniae]QND71035.1 DUF91 domain-containing protein [Tardiphaga robiniae]
MQDERFRRFILNSGLVEGTAATKSAALRRIERDEGIDLDEEYERDKLASLIERLQYTIDDFRAGKENPTKIDIEPEKLPRDLAFYRSVIQSYLKFKLSADGIAADSIAESKSAESVAEELVTEEVARKFGLESDLQRALRANISQFEDGLAIVDGGIECKVAAGYIDILAKDRSGSFVVIELKADVARAASVAQILAYMGCIKRERGGDVRGFLVAADFEDRVKFAADAVPNLSLRKYGFQFQFQNL